ncbi:MAG: threonine synthase, partial [Actinomycetota bacterium]|nr:threonine synthase [Actinomycetota bacterium]MDK1103836.1 threonine synthase [Actinomycetota bacterium]
MRWRGVIEEHREHLPVSDATPIVTLLEGGTPLIHAAHVSEIVERDVYLKFEGTNPTGSFKDRGMTLAVSKALEEGAKAVACASTGNTSASAAAYAARAGIGCIVVLPAGKIAAGKLAQAVAHGATIVPIEGNFDDALRIVVDLTDQHDVALVNSVNPYRIEAQKTAAFEVIADLGGAPGVHALPVGNAGNITAYWKGYTEVGERPRMWGFQAIGAAPIVFGEIFDSPETVATAIRIGNPASWDGAVSARDESGGRIEAVTDDEILAAYRMLSQKVGVFCEPASAAGVAGILKYKEDLPEGPVVCTVTGHGLKDPDTATRDISLPPSVSPDLGAVVTAA